jgi:hypothetical protein
MKRTYSPGASAATRSALRTSRTPASRSGSTLIGLQRSAGNAAVTRLIQRQEATSAVQNRPNLLGGSGPQLHLDPQIEAEIRRIELERKLDELLHPQKLRLALSQIQFQPPERPPWLPKAGERPPPDPKPLVPAGEGPATAKEASPSDLMDAVMAVPDVNDALTRLKTQAGERVQRDWGHLSTGEKVLVVSSGVVIAGTALGGEMSKEDSRNFVLQQISGKDLPVPGIDGLSVQFQTDPKNVGVTFTLDVGKHLPASWGFGGK